MTEHSRLSPKRLHHYIPKHYLRGFADSAEPTTVWVYKKGQAFTLGGKRRPRNPFRQSIRSAGSERDHYTLETIEGQKVFEKYENIIAQQEETGLPVLEKLRRRVGITLDEKIAFSFYIDLTMHRVPDRADHALGFIRRAMEAYPWDVLARKAAQEGRFSLALKFSRDRPETEKLLERELLLEGVVRRSENIIKQIASMTWQFFYVGGSLIFPTTDNPAFFPRGMGLRHKNGFVVFPIDSRLVLLISNVGTQDLAYTPATAAQYKLLKWTILAGATYRAYASRRESWIAHGLNRPRVK